MPMRDCTLAGMTSRQNNPLPISLWVSIDRLVRRQGAIWRSDNGIFNTTLEGAEGDYPREFKISNRNTIPHMTEMTVVRLLNF